MSECQGKYRDMLVTSSDQQDLFFGGHSSGVSVLCCLKINAAVRDSGMYLDATSTAGMLNDGFLQPFIPSRSS